MDDFNRYTPDWLNSRPPEEKKQIAAGPFGKWMHNRGCEYVAWLFWSGRARRPYAPTERMNGSMFFLDCGQGPFAVTAAHVYEAYLRYKDTHRVAGCQLGNIGFDLERRLIANGTQSRIDIATFRISAEEIRQIGKRIVTAEAMPWPAPPNPGEIVFFGGFPEGERAVIGSREMEFGLHSGMTGISDSTDYHLRCKFERQYWVDVRGHGLPPEDYNFSGISGGPMLVPDYRNGEWSWRLAGVIYEAMMSGPFEVLNAVRAHHILPDGRLRP